MSEEKLRDIVFWAGASGTQYKYYVANTERLVGMAGNFIWVDGAGRPVYIGEFGNLQQAFEPAVMQLAKAAGATALHLHNNLSGREARVKEQEDLIAKWAPVCKLPVK
jgi:hypothetical protein